MNTPSPQELAHEAREALQKSQETPQEHFERLIKRGWINSRGEVTRILGGTAEPEATFASANTTNVSGNGHR